MLKEVVIESINLKEKTVTVKSKSGKEYPAEFPDSLVDKAGEIFVEGMGTIFADIFVLINENQERRWLIKGFYQEV